MFELIRRVIETMPDVKLKPLSRKSRPELVSCHHLTRALARFFPVAYRDGHFNGGWCHSWLKVRGEPFIIDPYPWCTVGGPLLILYDFKSPYFRQYRRAWNDVVEYPEFEDQVDRVAAAVKATIRKLGIQREIDLLKKGEAAHI